MNRRFVRAFEIWLTDYREHPEQFMSDAECAAIACLPMAEQTAAYFEKMLAAVDAEDATWPKAEQP